MRRLTLVAILVVALAHVAGAQAPVAEWLFDEAVDGWAATDPNSQLSSTTDANVVREDGNGVLELSFTPVAGTIAGVASQIPSGLAGARSLHCHVRSSDQTIVMVALVEGDGSNYSAGFTSLPDRWQEVALDLNEFNLGDDSTDENGQLDPEQVQGIMVADAVAMLAMLSQQIPFIIAPDMSPRMLWMDDMWIGTDGVDPRWSQSEVDGLPTVKVDSFESAPLQWATLAGKGIEVAYDPDRKAEGAFSLRVTYDLPPQKAFAMMTSLRGMPLDGMEVLRFSYISEVATTLLVQVKELDDSEYSGMVPLAAADDFGTAELALADMTLSDNSTDENGKLDMAQAKEIVVADISAMTPTPVTLNTLWIDDVQFVK
jgi:hypothetical protein